MRYRRLILAVPVVACIISACGEVADPTSPANVAAPSANRLVPTDSVVIVGDSAPQTNGNETNPELVDGSPVTEGRGIGTIGSGN